MSDTASAAPLARPAITLAPLPRDQIGRVDHFTLPPDQAPFSAHPRDVMDAPDTRDGHVILADGQPAGFFAIDRDYPDHHDFAPEGTIGLRMFSVDHAQQGRGVASNGCRALAGYLAAQYPGTGSCYLTVNCRNADAYRVYIKGGFVDTGALYLGGGFGPQHIMCLDLKHPPAG